MVTKIGDKMKNLLLVILLAPFWALNAEPLIKQRMLEELSIIDYTFDVKYAPAEWKKKYAGWDLQEQINKAKIAVSVKENISIKDFQRILLAFFKSTRDYHVDVTYNSTEMAFLPFRIQGANGRYFFVWIDRQNTKLPISKGDELITVDGKPIADVIAELKSSELGNPESLTDQAKAEMLFSERIGSLGHAVPSGDISIGVKHLGTKKSATYRLSWQYIPEQVQNSKIAFLSPRASCDVPSVENPHSFFHKEMTAGFYNARKAAKTAFLAADEDNGPDPLGAKYSFVPILGKITWKAPSEIAFHAYIYKTPSKKTIGYIRISDYFGGTSGPSTAAKEFQELIEKFEEQTDALVIDQVDNPGGEVLYMYALAAMLADTPLIVPKHVEAITQEDVMESIIKLKDYKKSAKKKSNDKTISGYPVNAELIKNLSDYCQFIIAEWNAGHLITSPVSIYGIQTIKSAKKHYTKPILMLVNEMSLSCGDFLPAMMQDNKRAVIFGTTTAGAGGCIMNQSHANLLGIKEYVITCSVAVRLDDSPIENMGVTPDIMYNITEEDLQNDYLNYAAAVQKAVDNLFKKK